MRLKKKQNKPSSVTVQGIVELSDYRGDDNPFEAVIVTDDDDEFYLDIPSDKVEQYIDYYVRVSGVLYQQQGNMAILVKRIDFIESHGAYADLDAAHYDGGYDELYDDDDEIHDFMRFSTRNGGGRYSDEF